MSSSTDSLLIDLQSKLDSHKLQYDQIKKLLLTKPNDEILNKLYNDLKSVIELTEELTLAKSKTNNPIGKTSKFSINQRIAAKYPDNRWFIGSINSINMDNNTCNVTNLDNGTIADLSLDSIRPHAGVDVNQLAINMPIRAIFKGDGLYYDAVINKINTATGIYSITFTEYGDESDVIIDDILLTQESKKFIPSTAKVLVPDYLKPKPGDSEEVAASKRRRLKAIKNNSRQDKLENELNERANKWQEFNKKSKTLSKSASSTGATSSKTTSYALPSNNLSLKRKVNESDN